MVWVSQPLYLTPTPIWSGSDRIVHYVEGQRWGGRCVSSCIRADKLPASTEKLISNTQPKIRLQCLIELPHLIFNHFSLLCDDNHQYYCLQTVSYIFSNTYNHQTLWVTISFARIIVDNMRFCKWRICWNPSFLYVSFGFIFNSILWQCCAYGLFRFRHKNTWSGI